MKILAEMPTGMGGKWVLVQYKEDFFAYGYEQDLHTLMGFPVNQCGTQNEVLNHCKSIAELCKNNIAKYQKERSKDTKNISGWELLIQHEQKELEMLTEFARILSNKINF